MRKTTTDTFSTADCVAAAYVFLNVFAHVFLNVLANTLFRLMTVAVYLRVLADGLLGMLGLLS